ncbi:General amino acid permease [Lachnellula occidentalis]|uniref:General amino acid permease n=1 Tax=Lachnellula occidentalis TaxID=215460 RepID=A0A8H8RZC3_9HELO|nr:General amino acid permease [Lachnellula occidentalis]
MSTSSKQVHEKGPPDTTVASDSASGSVEVVNAESQHLQRKMRGKEVQLFAIGGAIGTSLFVQMGSALPKGGPAGLFLGFVIWSVVMLAVNECFAEMVCYMPVPSPFIRFGSEWVDEAFGFAMGWNFFLNMAFLVPFEIVALNILFSFWTTAIPVYAVIIVVMILYAILNVISVRWFGIAEFYLSIFKVLLICGCIAFTFITMVGGNPEHDRYGFRYWRNPGSFIEYGAKGNTGRSLGVLTCVIQATFSICGPEYVTMTAAEAANPRKILPMAFRSFVWRILIFFCGSALCIGIVIPSNDPTLAAVLDGESKGTGAASPYVIAMQRLDISGLADLVNALIMTSVFSAGNGILFSATRTLYGMSLKGEAPRCLSNCTKAGIPLYCLGVSISFCLLAFLQISSSSSAVLGYLVDLVTACQLINYMCTAITYRHFYAALKAQGISRDSLPYKGRFQPYTSYFAIGGCLFMILASGYYLFLDGAWDIMYFFLTYAMLGFFFLAAIFWKVVKRTTYVKPGTADLELDGQKQEIDVYEAIYTPSESGKQGGFFNRMFE